MARIDFLSFACNCNSRSIPFDKKDIFEQTYPGKSYPVEILYHSRDYTNLKGKDYTKLFEDLIEVVANHHKISQLTKMKTMDGLYFVRKNEINTVCEGLKKLINGVIIIPLYSKYA